ncbi:CopD family protein [Massilia scottii]|uniref:CopD family protein n=1 Tax=Massilia scottii TaxID=3057166 RepID=UPI002796537D|nr:CopD family protein [Massilia sp. CCM 9029]MDQ1831910.1 CopD family protein [Massilia sp. CCM 9029]
MMYLLLKTLHIVAVMTWIGGLLMQAFLLRTVARQPLPLLPDERSVIGAAVRWDRLLIAPAMLLAWACGLALATLGHWWMTPWLSLKMVLVPALSAVHGIQGGSLRRMVDSPARRAPACLRYATAAVLCGVTAIVFLVVLKPG